MDTANTNRGKSNMATTDEARMKAAGAENMEGVAIHEAGVAAVKEAKAAKKKAKLKGKK